MSVSITVSGPIFHHDAPGLARQAVEDSVQALLELGEEHLDELLRPRPAGVYLAVAEADKGKGKGKGQASTGHHRRSIDPAVAEAGQGQASTGHYRRSIHGERKGTVGRIDDSRVIYGPWLEGTSSRNQTTRFKGYSSFRLTAQWLQQQTAKVLAHQVKRLIQKLGG